MYCREVIVLSLLLKICSPFYLALALVISCWLRWTVSSCVILAISPMSTWCNMIFKTQARQLSTWCNMILLTQAGQLFYLFLTSCPRECSSSSGFLGIERSWLGTVAFLGRAGEDAKVRVNPWFGVILPSAYLPVRGSGVV